MSSEGSAIVVTGASTGIGRACALQLDRKGFRVFAGVRKPADGEALREHASERLAPLRIDVTDAASIEAAAKTVSAEVGDRGLAGLVNNAGISVNGPLEFVELEDLRWQLEVNVVGQVAVTQAFLPLIRQATGRIVNIGSIGGHNAAPFVGPYAASKFALEAVTEGLRRELRPWGIHVAIVDPGAIQTEIWEKAFSEADRQYERWSDRAKELYGHARESVLEMVRSQARAAIPPERVADAVEHALTASRPRPHYTVGRDAKILRVILALLPKRIVDRIVLKAMGLES